MLVRQELAVSRENLSSRFPTRSDTKRAVQPHKIVEADLRLCFRSGTYDSHSHILKTRSSMTGCHVSVSVACSKNLYLILAVCTALVFSITKTSPCNEHPLTPHFYIVKLGFTGVCFFLIFAPKHRLWVLIRTASMRRF